MFFLLRFLNLHLFIVNCLVLLERKVQRHTNYCNSSGMLTLKMFKTDQDNRLMRNAIVAVLDKKTRCLMKEMKCHQKHFEKTN